MEESPKLYDNKPKKAQMNKVKGIDVKSSISSTISSYYSTGSSGNGSNGGVSKSPEIPKESFVKRYKWPLILAVSFAAGAYLFTSTKKKDRGIEEEITIAASLSTSLPPPTATPATENMPEAQPARVLAPVPEHQQRELFKWMLDEKRKIKTNDPLEKKRIDEEKALLKQFIRAKSIPSI